MFGNDKKHIFYRIKNIFNENKTGEIEPLDTH